MGRVKNGIWPLETLEIRRILENISYFLTFGNLRFPMLKRFAFDSPKNLRFLRISEHKHFVFVSYADKLAQSQERRLFIESVFKNPQTLLVFGACKNRRLLRLKICDFQTLKIKAFENLRFSMPQKSLIFDRFLSAIEKCMGDRYA
jgi:hypothetical protein